MGWFGGESTESNKTGNLYDNLDPSLKEFLESELRDHDPIAPSKVSSNTTGQLLSGRSTPPSSHDRELNSAVPAIEQQTVPSASLFPDGRYAHLWKTYRANSVVEAEARSDQEKLQDVLESYKDRKSKISDVALENCAEEHLAVAKCYETGKISEKLLLCRPQKRKFLRCHEMQSRFLTSLGYLSTHNRDVKVDDAIQMHADTLYHRMLEREEATERARAAGEPLPVFPPLNIPLKLMSSELEQKVTQAANPGGNESATTVARALASDTDLPTLNPQSEKLLKPTAALALRERLRNLSPDERSAEEQATIARLTSAAEVAEEVTTYLDRMQEDRRKRRDEGTATFFDKVAGILGN